jgi:hypothetical protein
MRAFCRAADEPVKLRSQRRDLIAKDFSFEIETLRGADSASSSSNPKTQLVEAKLEMARAAWLLQHGDGVRRFY